MSPTRPTLWIVCPVYLDVEGFFAVRARCREALAGEAAAHFARLRFVAADDTGGRDPQIQRLREEVDV